MGGVQNCLQGADWPPAPAPADAGIRHRLRRGHAGSAPRLLPAAPPRASSAEGAMPTLLGRAHPSLVCPRDPAAPTREQGAPAHCRPRFPGWRGAPALWRGRSGFRSLMGEGRPGRQAAGWEQGAPGTTSRTEELWVPGRLVALLARMPPHPTPRTLKKVLSLVPLKSSMLQASGPASSSGLVGSSPAQSPPHPQKARDGASWDGGSERPATTRIAPDSWGPQPPWEELGAGNQERGTRLPASQGPGRWGCPGTSYADLVRPPTSWPCTPSSCAGGWVGSRPCWGLDEEDGTLGDLPRGHTGAGVSGSLSTLASLLKPPGCGKGPRAGTTEPGQPAPTHAHPA